VRDVQPLILRVSGEPNRGSVRSDGWGHPSHSHLQGEVARVSPGKLLWPIGTSGRAPGVLPEARGVILSGLKMLDTPPNQFKIAFSAVRALDAASRVSVPASERWQMVVKARTEAERRWAIPTQD
jgi:hypothetical protein